MLVLEGLNLRFSSRAYVTLQSLAEGETVDKCSIQAPSKLHPILHEELASRYDKRQMKMKIAHMTRELQNWRKLSQIRDKMAPD